jgi:excisionase family DNA binding protein
VVHVRTMHAQNQTTDRVAALLDKWETARTLNIGKRTLDVWMRAGRIPYLKIGKTVRFRLPDVLEKLNAYRVN